MRLVLLKALPRGGHNISGVLGQIGACLELAEQIERGAPMGIGLYDDRPGDSCGPRTPPWTEGSGGMI